MLFVLTPPSGRRSHRWIGIVNFYEFFLEEGCTESDQPGGTRIVELRDHQVGLVRGSWPLLSSCELW